MIRSSLLILLTALSAIGEAQGRRVLLDEAHHNVHTLLGTYKPFADLLRGEGYRLAANKRVLDAGALADCDVLVISNPRGAPETAPLERRAEPAFTDAEADAVAAWVKQGGSLLLIADHWPIGPATQGLASRFGVRMSGGWTEDAAHTTTRPGHLLFSREQGLIGDHAITRGRNGKERVHRVMSFLGQSLEGPSTSVALLRLSPTAVDRLPPDRRTVTAAGRSQGLTFEFGKGRVVVLGEAAMLTVQPGMEMDVPGNDNRQLGLNIMGWLSRR